MGRGVEAVDSGDEVRGVTGEPVDRRDLRLDLLLQRVDSLLGEQPFADQPRTSDAQWIAIPALDLARREVTEIALAFGVRVVSERLRLDEGRPLPRARPPPRPPPPLSYGHNLL